MISALMALAAFSAGQAPQADAAYIRCAFERAGELATSTGDLPEAVADSVVEACAEAGGANGPPMTDAVRYRVRAAAVAVVNRRRGLDGQPPDAPIRLPNLTSALPGARLEIPDEIARAIIPYVTCRLASAGIPLRASPDGPEWRPAVALGADCSATRVQAAGRAEAMLRDRRWGSRSERRVRVEQVLSNVDEFISNSLAAPGREEKPDAENR